MEGCTIEVGGANFLDGGRRGGGCVCVCVCDKIEQIIVHQTVPILRTIPLPIWDMLGCHDIGDVPELINNDYINNQ